VAVVVAFLAGLCLSVVGELARRGRLRPNSVVGFRLPSTGRSPAAWYAGHAAAGWPLVATGLLTMASAALGLLAWSLEFVPVAVLLTGSAVAGLAADRAARRAAGAGAR
jgi:hypothetical protein